MPVPSLKIIGTCFALISSLFSNEDSDDNEGEEEGEDEGEEKKLKNSLNIELIEENQDILVEIALKYIK